MSRFPPTAKAVVAGWLLATVMLLGVPVSARAASRQAATLTAGKAICDAAVTHREATLSALIAEVGAAPHVTQADKATLSAALHSAAAGLQALKTSFDADRTLAQLRVDCRRIVTGFYVYLFLVPQVHLVAAADRVQSASGPLSDLAGLIGDQITAAAARGENVSSAQGYDTDISTQLAAAEQAAATAAATVVVLAASGYPGNRPTIESARASLGDAERDLAAAVSAASAALAALKVA
ncbi:MAG TPA: hypothetical protein VKY26_10545 [Actinomycetota bacterium]|nr:hypothetical protein [Actinomycetota bacterium]